MPIIESVFPKTLCQNFKVTGKYLKYSILEFIKGYSSHHRSTVHALVLLVWLLSTKPQEAFWQLFSIELLSTALKVMTTASLLMPIEMLRESKRQKCSFFLLFSLSEYRITHINAIFFLFSLFRKWSTNLANQGCLKIWTSDSHWFSLSLEPLEISLQKFQHSYNSWKNGFWQNLEGVAQKLNLPRPLEVLDIFGGKSKFWEPRTFIFGTKRVPIEFDNWWKFGDDISNHLWEIQN